MNRPQDYVPSGTTGERLVELVSDAVCYSDFVFRQPSYLSGSRRRECCDILIAVNGYMCAIQIKSMMYNDVEFGNQDYIQNWIQKSSRTNSRQASGAVRALINGRVTEAFNSVRGRVLLEKPVPSRVFALGVYVIPEGLDMPLNMSYVSQYKIPYIEMSIFQFVDIMATQLTTPGDLFGYLKYRATLTDKIDVNNCCESDIVEHYLAHDRNPSLNNDDSQSDKVLAGTWRFRKYAGAALEARQIITETSDFDTLIRHMHQFAVGIPQTPRSDWHKSHNYAAIASHLAMIRRKNRDAIIQYFTLRSRRHSNIPDSVPISVLCLFQDQPPILFVNVVGDEEYKINVLNLCSSFVLELYSMKQLIGVCVSPNRNEFTVVNESVLTDSSVLEIKPELVGVAAEWLTLFAVISDDMPQLHHIQQVELQRRLSEPWRSVLNSLENRAETPRPLV